MRGPSQFVRPGSCAIPHDGWSAKAVKPKLLEALRPGGRRSRNSRYGFWPGCKCVPVTLTGTRIRGTNLAGIVCGGMDQTLVSKERSAEISPVLMLTFSSRTGPFRSSKPEAIPQTLLATRHQPRKSTD
jgi:hypothetical protein